MWLKILILLFMSSVISTGVSIPKRPNLRSRDHDSLHFSDENDGFITPFVDPVDGINYRLPNNTVPLHYDVYFSTDIHIGSFPFHGQVRIQIEAVEATTTVTLHQRQLDIGSISLLRESGSTWQSNVSYEYDAEREFLEISPRLPITAGTIFWLSIDFSGTMRGDEAGFYRSSYYDIDGNRRWLGVTQFESTDARHGFPCYDEPGRRSTFSIKIRHHLSYTAVSNMPVISMEREPLTEYVITTFDKTPLVQTYLIAYMVSDFLFAEEDFSDTPQRVYAKPQSIHNNEFELALNVSGPLLDTFGRDYLKIPYSLPKMDQAAIPDFDAGAMENWGLVTYREQYLLWNSKTGSTGAKQDVEETIAHEFAHQHFGNLVSPTWWHYLWLNEGFANLYENFMMHLIYPNDRWMDSYQVYTFMRVMETDSNPNIRAMTYYVERPQGIERLFDSVAYSKSGSVLRTFQNAFSDPTWSKGLNRYLTKMQFKSATSADLYAGIQEAVDEDWPTNTLNVSRVMSSWELQSGFPFVTVSRNGNSLDFEQNRFMYGERNSENLWWIPVSYRIIGRTETDMSTAADFWIPNERTFTLSGSSAPRPFTSSDLVLINYQQAGYYRVNYDTELWIEMIDSINNPEKLSHFHILNRAQLIDDSFHLARANLINYDVLLGLMNYLEHETDSIPWIITNRAHVLLDRWISGTEVHSNYREMMRKNSRALFLRLGADVIDNEQKLDRYARPIALDIACSSGVPECLNAANERLRQALIEHLPSNPMHQDLFSSVYCNGIRIADIHTFDRTLSKGLRSPAGTERNAILSGLGCTSDMQLLEMYFDFAINAVGLTNTDRSRMLNSATNNGETSVRLMIDFVSNNFEGINRFPNVLNTMCSNIASRIFNQDMHDSFASLLDRLVEAEALTNNQRNAHMANSVTILEWQDRYLSHFQGFFD